MLYSLVCKILAYAINDLYKVSAYSVDSLNVYYLRAYYSIIFTS